MKTQALEGRSAASWRNLPHIQMVLVQQQEAGTAGLWSLQAKIRDSWYSDSEILRFEGPYRHPRTDHMATSRQSCLKAMSKGQQCRDKFTFCTRRLESVHGMTPGSPETLTV